MDEIVFGLLSTPGWLGKERGSSPCEFFLSIEIYTFMSVLYVHRKKVKNIKGKKVLFHVFMAWAEKGVGWYYTVSGSYFVFITVQLLIKFIRLRTQEILNSSWNCYFQFRSGIKKLVHYLVRALLSKLNILMYRIRQFKTLSFTGRGVSSTYLWCAVAQ